MVTREGPAEQLPWSRASVHTDVRSITGMQSTLSVENQINGSQLSSQPEAQILPF